MGTTCCGQRKEGHPQIFSIRIVSTVHVRVPMLRGDLLDANYVGQVLEKEVRSIFRMMTP